MSDAVLDYLARLRSMEPSERMLGWIDELEAERLSELAAKCSRPPIDGYVTTGVTSIPTFLETQIWSGAGPDRATSGPAPICARCGEPALGYATIGELRYCHADERSCYTEQHREDTRARTGDLAHTTAVLDAFVRNLREMGLP